MDNYKNKEVAAHKIMTMYKIVNTFTIALIKYFFVCFSFFILPRYFTAIS